MQYTEDILHVTVPDSKKIITTESDGSVLVKVILQANKMTAKKTTIIARSLFKILFESATKKYGNDWALLQKNDALRDMVLNGIVSQHGFVAMQIAKTHDACFRVHWDHVPPYVGLHNVNFTVGLFGEDVDADQLKKESMRNKYNIFFF